MKKKRIIIVILWGFITTFFLADDVYCLLYDPLLEVDKEDYYINEVIFINASWELYYNELTENVYVQIQIYKNFS